ncbi:hypothetical protein AOQ84DRAFT_411290, partial [Glonium stellatum]
MTARRAPAVGTAKSRLPVRAPSQAKPNTPYSHIQIVSKEENDFTDDADYQDDTPTYRSPSLQYLAPFDETSHQASSYNKAQMPTAPASYNQTFADMARKANNRELYDGQEPPPSGPVPLAGLIKFKANRNKGNKAWRPLDLSDFDDDKPDEEELPQVGEGSIQSLTFNNRTQNEPSQPRLSLLAARASYLSLPKLQTDIPNHPVQHHQIAPSERFSLMQPPPHMLAMFQQDRGDDVSPKNTRAGTEDEIIQIFGRRLPDPIYLQQVMGKVDGEVTFIGHPNRDVSAHQWSAASFQWSNIGQFSHIRHKVEGQLASDRLRGQTIGMSMPQNTLAYFKAIAEQRGMIMVEKSRLEKQQLGERFSEAGFMLPRARAPTDSSRRPTLVESENFGSLSSTSGPVPGSRFPTLGNLAVAREARLNQGPPTAPSLLSNIDTLTDDPFITSNQFQSSNMPATAALPTPPNRGSAVPSRLSGMDFSFEFPPRVTNQWRPDSPQTSAGDEARKEFFARQEQERIRQDLWPQERHTTLREISVGEDAASSLEGSSQRRRTFGQDQELSPEQMSKREKLKERLFEFSNLAGSHTGISAANRVPIPDPTAAMASAYDRAPAFPPGFEPPATTTQAHRTSTLNANAPPYNRVGFLNPPPHTSSESPTLTSATAATTNLRFSDPDIVRPSHIPEIAPGLSQQAPTPQNLAGPFFADTIPTAHAPTTPLAPRLAEPEKLELWWTNGQQPARQEAFYRSIMGTAAANARIRGGDNNNNNNNNNNNDHANPNPNATISPPDSATTPAPTPAEAAAGSITNRLLVPLYENLRLYADEAAA